jgi:hypothetical protein
MTAIHDLFNLRVVAGKNVYIVDDHHKAFAAWVLERRKLAGAPNLITLDHHTDVSEAFHNHACVTAQETEGLDPLSIEEELLGQVNWRDDESVSGAIELLCHDEQIHAATMSDTLGVAYCIQLSELDGYACTDRMHVIGHECAIGCEKPTYDDECKLHLANEIIESPYLEDQLRRASEVSTSLGQGNVEDEPFILDIDLDVFHTLKSIEPKDPKTFHRLIAGAVAITIATEAECVEDEWLDEEAISVDELLCRLLRHIEIALNSV